MTSKNVDYRSNTLTAAMICPLRILMYFGKIETRSLAALIEFADTSSRTQISSVRLEDIERKYLPFVPICAIIRPIETKAAPARPLRDPTQKTTMFTSDSKPCDFQGQILTPVVYNLSFEEIHEFEGVIGKKYNHTSLGFLKSH